MEKVVKRGKASITVKEGSGRCKGCVAGRKRNGIASCEGEKETWGKGTFLTISESVFPF